MVYGEEGAEHPLSFGSRLVAAGTDRRKSQGDMLRGVRASTAVEEVLPQCCMAVRQACCVGRKKERNKYRKSES